MNKTKELKTTMFKNKRIVARGIYKTFIFKTVSKIKKFVQKWYDCIIFLFQSIERCIYISTINDRWMCN